jgi:hypothetical protein
VLGDRLRVARPDVSARHRARGWTSSPSSTPALPVRATGLGVGRWSGTSPAERQATRATGSGRNGAGATLSARFRQDFSSRLPPALRALAKLRSTTSSSGSTRGSAAAQTSSASSPTTRQSSASPVRCSLNRMTSGWSNAATSVESMSLILAAHRFEDTSPPQDQTKEEAVALNAA